MNTATYTHLTDHEQDQIAVFRAQGLSQNEIARRVGRDKGTISRELKRNRSPVYRVYLPIRHRHAQNTGIEQATDGNV